MIYKAYIIHLIILRGCEKIISSDEATWSSNILCHFYIYYKIMGSFH
jgi:hypothetical protein